MELTYAKFQMIIAFRTVGVEEKGKENFEKYTGIMDLNFTY